MPAWAMQYQQGSEVVAAVRSVSKPNGAIAKEERLGAVLLLAQGGKRFTTFVHLLDVRWLEPKWLRIFDININIYHIYFILYISYVFHMFSNSLFYFPGFPGNKQF